MIGAGRPGQGCPGTSSWSPRTSGLISGVAERGASGFLLMSGSPGRTGREDAGRRPLHSSDFSARVSGPAPPQSALAQGRPSPLPPGSRCRSACEWHGACLYGDRVRTRRSGSSMATFMTSNRDLHSRRPQEVDDGPNVRPAPCVAGDPCAIQAMAQKLGKAAWERRSLRPGLACRGRGMMAPPSPLLLVHGARGGVVCPRLQHAERLLRWEPKESGRERIGEPHPALWITNGNPRGGSQGWRAVASRAIRAATPFAVALASQRYPWNALLLQRPLRLMMVKPW